MEGFNKMLEKELKIIVWDDYFPKHWLSFHMLSFPIDVRFPEDSFVSNFHLYLYIIS